MPVQNPMLLDKPDRLHRCSPRFFDRYARIGGETDKRLDSVSRRSHGDALSLHHVAHSGPWPQTTQGTYGSPRCALAAQHTATAPRQSGGWARAARTSGDPLRASHVPRRTMPGILRRQSRGRRAGTPSTIIAAPPIGRALAPCTSSPSPGGSTSFVPPLPRSFARSSSFARASRRSRATSAATLRSPGVRGRSQNSPATAGASGRDIRGSSEWVAGGVTLPGSWCLRGGPRRDPRFDPLGRDGGDWIRFGRIAFADRERP